MVDLDLVKSEKSCFRREYLRISDYYLRRALQARVIELLANHQW